MHRYLLNVRQPKTKEQKIEKEKEKKYEQRGGEDKEMDNEDRDTDNERAARIYSLEKWDQASSAPQRATGVERSLQVRFQRSRTPCLKVLLPRQTRIGETHGISEARGTGQTREMSESQGIWETQATASRTKEN